MADETKDQRIVVLMTPTELEAIDAWSFANRIRSRGEAIRRLCQSGLTVEAEIKEFEAMAKDVNSAARSLNAIYDEDVTDMNDWLSRQIDLTDALMDKATDLSADVLKLGAVGRYFSGAKSDEAPTKGDDLRKLLADSRAKRTSPTEILGKKR